MRTFYTNVYEINPLQQKVVRYIDYWVHVESRPISQKEIIQEMKTRGEDKHAVIFAIKGLLRLGYLRKSVTSEGDGNTAAYVQLRGI